MDIPIVLPVLPFRIPHPENAYFRPATRHEKELAVILIHISTATYRLYESFFYFIKDITVVVGSVDMWISYSRQRWLAVPGALLRVEKDGFPGDNCAMRPRSIPVSAGRGITYPQGLGISNAAHPPLAGNVDKLCTRGGEKRPHFSVRVEQGGRQAIAYRSHADKERARVEEYALAEISMDTFAQF
jgi:hypothetical protein